MKIWMLIVPVAVLFGGCASAPPADTGPTPNQVILSGEARDAVHWGGRIVAVKNLRERTLVEVLSFPLDGDGRPRADKAPQGRFIVEKTGFLEPHEYAAGRLVEVRGRLDGFTRGRVGEAAYRYPVVRGDQLVLWSSDESRRWSRTPRINLGVGGGSRGAGVGVGIGF